MFVQLKSWSTCTRCSTLTILISLAVAAVTFFFDCQNLLDEDVNEGGCVVVMEVAVEERADEAASGRVGDIGAM